MSGVKARHRAVVVAAVLAALVPAVTATAQAERASCGERDFCLFAGPHQTGKILFQRMVTVDDGEEGTVHLVNEEEINPRIRPRSARLPGLPEGLSCIAVLSEETHFQGDYQEADYGYPLDQDAVTELSGRPVGSIDSDCG
jgi:hypothetical protein